MEPRATIRDVAAAAGVSPATVSLALNGRGTVKTETAERVMAAAEELGYRASRIARALRTSRTGTLALVLSSVEAGSDRPEELSFDAYMRVIRAATETALHSDHRLLISPPLRSSEDLVDLAVDGAILCDTVPGDGQLDLCRRLDTPVVTIERDPDHPDHRWHVNSDNAESMRMLLDHLHAAGARRIAVLTSGWGNTWTVDSLRGYLAWTRERGLEPIVDAANGTAADLTAYERAGVLLDGPNAPDAIIGLPERYASEVLRAARNRGITVPGELLVATGIDSIDAREGHPSVTALDLDPAAVGRAAVQLLLSRIRGEEAEAPVTIPAVLRVRESSAGIGA
jgi:DNA-binding LacI/PurR family transcriptional regulator